MTFRGAPEMMKNYALTSFSDDVVDVIDEVTILVILDVRRSLNVFLFRQQQLHRNQRPTNTRCSDEIGLYGESKTSRTFHTVI